LHETNSEAPRSLVLGWGARFCALAAGLAEVCTVSSGRLKIFGVILVALVPASFVLESRILDTKYWRYSSAVLLSVALLIGGLWIVRSPESPLGPPSAKGGKPVPTVAPSSSATAPTANFTIDLPDQQALPLCPQLSGAGSIPKAQTLLIFDRPANSDMNGGDNGARYFLDGAAANRPGGEGWFLDNVSVGDPTEKVELVAELVTSQLSKFFGSLKYKVPNAGGKGASDGPPGTTWLSTVLPPGKVVANAFGQRDDSSISCK
jgi:hypothetical protein